MADKIHILSRVTPLLFPGVQNGYNIRTYTRGIIDQNQFIPEIVFYYTEISPAQYAELSKNPQTARFVSQTARGENPLRLYGARLANSNVIRPVELSEDGNLIDFANTSGSRELDTLIQETTAIDPQLYIAGVDAVREQTGLPYINPTSAVASTDTGTGTGTPADSTGTGTGTVFREPGSADVSGSFNPEAPPQTGGFPQPPAPGEAPGTGSGTGTGAGTGTPPGGATTGSTGSQPGQQATINTQITRTRKEALIYPSDMRDDQDRIKFELWKSKKEFNADPATILTGLRDGGTPEDSLYERVGGDIVYLPITKISDTNSVDWTDDRMDPLQLEIAKASLAFMTPETQTQGVDRLRALVTAFGESQAYGNMVRLRLAGEAAGGVNLLQRATGGIFNPNLELLFNGPQLRSFQFNVGMISRNDGDATNIKKIIKFFKQNMAARKSAGGTLFLESPYVFQIEYQSGGGLHQSLNKIKKCALQTCSVDYTPMGSYMTFNDETKTMFMYTMTLQFKELHPIYSDNYSDHPIGF